MSFDDANELQADLPSSGLTLPCPKCGESNAAPARRCQACRAHLQVVCHHCGHKNHRAETHCSGCQQRLHRAWWKRLTRRAQAGTRRWAAWHVALGAAAVWLTYRVIVFFAEYDPPVPK